MILIWTTLKCRWKSCMACGGNFGTNITNRRNFYFKCSCIRYHEWKCCNTQSFILCFIKHFLLVGPIVGTRKVNLWAIRRWWVLRYAIRPKLVMFREWRFWYRKNDKRMNTCTVCLIVFFVCIFVGDKINRNALSGGWSTTHDLYICLIS